MTADAFSDLVLTLACLGLGFLLRQRNRAISLALLSIAIAAGFGVARFSGVFAANGPHEFFSLMATVAGVPLLAAGLIWRDGVIAQHWRAAVLLAASASALGVLLVVMAAQLWWQQVAPGIAVVGIIIYSWQQRDLLTWLGCLFLLAAFLVSALQWRAGLFSSEQLLHYLMVIGLSKLCIAYQRQRFSAVALMPAHP